MTLISRLLGFVRDAVIAGVFGADAMTDAFFVAFRIPNFLRRLFAEGSFAQAFVPVLSRYRGTAPEAALTLFLDRTTGSLALSLTIVTATGVLAAPVLVSLFAPGFLPHEHLFTATRELVQITLPYLLLITVTGLFGATLNTYGQFAIPAATPVFLNLTMIGAALWGAPLLAEPIYALAWAVLCAGFVQLLFQIPFLAAIRRLPRPRLGFGDPDVRRVLGSLGPTVLSVSVTQVNVLVNTVVASFLASGSVSWLYYSDRLVEFPVGLFGVALGTVMLPHFAASSAESEGARFSASLDWALRVLLAITLPSTLGLMMLAKPLLFALFQYDEFTSEDVAMTARSLVAYAAGLVGFVAARLLLAGFAARHDYATPFRLALYAIALNLLLSVLLSSSLVPSGWRHAGIALATGIAGLIHAGWLGVFLRKAGAYRPLPGWGPHVLRVVGGCVAMGALLAYGVGDDAVWGERSALERIGRLGILIASAIAVYAGSLYLLGMRLRHLTLVQYERHAI